MITQLCRAIEAADKSSEQDNIYSAYAKGILADALYVERDYKGAADLYSEALKTYERHYKGVFVTSPDAVEEAGLRFMRTTIPSRRIIVTTICVVL